MSEVNLNIGSQFESYLESLSETDIIELEAARMGYRKLPPTIREFLNDEYYLGKIYGNGALYPYWIPILEDIYPSPIHVRYTNIILTGCIGSGKSTVSKICAAYTRCKIDHLDNLKVFLLSPGKDLVMSFFHTTDYNCRNTFIDPWNDWFDKSNENYIPYFTEGLLNSSRHVALHVDTPRGKGPIG